MLSKHQICLRHFRRLPSLVERSEERPLLKLWHRSSSDLRASNQPGTERELQETSKPFSNLPFVKDLFLGKYDTKFLVYPEFSKTEELDNLKSRLEPVQRIFDQEVDSRTIDESGTIPDEIFTRIKELGLFGQEMNTFHGGMGLDSKGCTRLNEIIGVDGSLSTVIAAHNDMALQTILLYGSEEQKDKYLLDLAHGKKIGGYCIAEKESGSDIGSIRTTAIAPGDGTSFVLNGTKTWVTNGSEADVFVVFARCELETVGGKEDHVTAFIVDRSTEGVSISEPTTKLGLRGASTCDVHFENAVIPAENLIGNVGTGFQIALSIMNKSRLSEGANVTGVLKKLTGLTVDYVINRKQFKKPLSEFGLVQDKCAAIGLKTYVLESMTYLTAGVNDQYMSPDTSLESAIVKVYATETAWECLRDFVQIYGAAACLDDSPVQRHLRDAYTNFTYRGTNDMLRLYVSLLGLQHSSEAMIDTVRKTRNPFNNVGWTLKRNFKLLGNDPKNPRLVHKLYDHVHPTVSFAAEELEKRVHQFHSIVEFCLSAYGKEIIDEQITLKRLADVTIDLYGITAVLARASRSMSIGLKNADHEVLMAQLFAREASQRIGYQLEQLREGKYENGDEIKTKIANTMFKARGYAAEHPLERNW